MTRVAPPGSWRMKKSKPLSLVAGCVVSATAWDHWQNSHTSPNEAAVVVQTSSDLTPSPTLGHSNWLPRSGPKPTQWRKAMKDACPVLSRRPRREAAHQIPPGPSGSMAGDASCARAYRWSVIGQDHRGG